MQSALLFALALLVRSILSVDGAAVCPLDPGQSIVSAYSATFEPIWHHAVPTTITDRVTAARAGRVTGLGPADRLVVAIADDNATFDTTRPVKGESDTFPYSPDFARRYERFTGRDYVRDMMVVVAENLGSRLARIRSVTDMYDVLANDAPASPTDLRRFGSGARGSILVVTSRSRTWCWLDACFGDDGVSYARMLSERGYRVDLVDRRPFERLSIDGEGFVTADGKRYDAMILRHLSFHDAEEYRRTFGTHPLRTKVYATDTPILFGAEIIWSSPSL